MNHLKLARTVSVMGSGIHYDAILVIDRNAEVGQSSHGEIYFDKADRFEDGTRVVTSTVQSIIGVTTVQPIEEGAPEPDRICPYFIKTRNTTYLVVVP